MNKKIISGLFIIAVIAVLIMINIKWSGGSKEQAVIKLPDVKCNAQKKVCKVELDEFNIEISFDNNIYYLKPFNIFVWTEAKTDFNVKSIQVDFKMKNMNMGVNHFSLRKTEFENKKQKWQGKALLPVCVTGRADWFAELEVVAKQAKYILSIPLSVKKAAN